MKLEKVTNKPKRLYEDACGAAHALDLVGERWALLVVRELMLGPKRFSDLKASLPGISANVLTQRLEGLEASGVLLKRRLDPPANTQVYELTPWGYEAEPVFQTLGRWAARSPSHDPTLPLSATSLLLSFRTMIDSARAKGLNVRIGLKLDGESYVATLADGGITVARGDPRGADLTFTGAAPVIAAAIYGGVPFDVLEADGALRLEGDRTLAERFRTLFPLPDKVIPST